LRNVQGVRGLEGSAARLEAPTGEGWPRGGEALMAIIPDAHDHAAHIASRMPRVECAECAYLPRWPIKKIGYLVPNGYGGLAAVGWEFDTSVPDTYPWLLGDIRRFADLEKALSRIPTINDS